MIESDSRGGGVYVKWTRDNAAMNDRQEICDPRWIDQCLDDSLHDDERAAFEAHLETCSVCREALERRAASATDWQSAREFLSSQASDPPTRSGEEQHHDENAVPLVDSVLAILAPTDDPRMLGRLGGYEIAGVVGSGGMGVVLKGFDLALNRFVAIKLLAPHLAVSGAARQRFAREARSAASVVHENVVAIHAVADAGPLPYFVMPYLRGASLQKRLDRHGPLGIAEILRVAMQIAAGLAAAHAQGLVHRDIKPANIMLEDGVERLKITDFGLARAADDASLTRTGVIAGTPEFMSPEQARGEAIDARSDLFSLGSLMYAMCTGRPPFRAETSYGILQRISNDEPRSIREINAAIPEWLAELVEKLHAKDPAERFQTAHEVAQLLEQCLAHLQQPTAVSLPQPVVDLLAEKTTPLWRWRVASLVSPPRRAIALFSIAGVVLLLVGIVGRVFWRVPASPTPPSSGQATIPATDSPNESHAGPTPHIRTTWDDDVAPQIIESEAAIRELENTASATWIPMPTNDADQQLHELQSEIKQLEDQVSVPWGLEPSANDSSSNLRQESNP
jgi:serine/threonine protein kinase